MSETALVNKPSVFEPLKVYCISVSPGVNLQNLSECLSKTSETYYMNFSKR